LAALVLWAAVPASSQQESGTLTAEEAVREALAANRELQAARFALDGARGRVLQAGRLQNPELVLRYADDFAFMAEGERNGSVGFAQSFPVTARLAREKDVARSELAIAEAELVDFARRLVALVQRAFYAIRALDEQTAVTRQLIASVREVEDATARRVAVAEASPADVSLLRIERLRLEQRAQQLLRDREVTAAALLRLLGRQQDSLERPVGDLDPGRESSPSGPEIPDRPDLERARRQIERARSARALARASVWEDWTLGLEYERERQVFDAPVGVKRDSFLRFGIDVPIPLWNRQQGRIASAQAELLRAQRRREAVEIAIQEEIRRARARFRTLRSSVDAYARQLLPEATRARDLFERGYRRGLVGIAELLQAERQYSDSRSVHLELLGDLRQAAIELEAARGSSPHLKELWIRGGAKP